MFNRNNNRGENMSYIPLNPIQYLLDHLVKEHLIYIHYDQYQKIYKVHQALIQNERIIGMMSNFNQESLENNNTIILNDVEIITKIQEKVIEILQKISDPIEELIECKNPLQLLKGILPFYYNHAYHIVTILMKEYSFKSYVLNSNKYHPLLAGEEIAYVGPYGHMAIQVRDCTNQNHNIPLKDLIEIPIEEQNIANLKTQIPHIMKSIKKFPIGYSTINLDKLPHYL